MTEKRVFGNTDTGGASNSAPQTRVLFYKVRVNMQIIRENPPFFEVYYIRGHMKPRVGDKLYTKTWNKKYVSANMIVDGFSRGAIRPAPAGE